MSKLIFDIETVGEDFEALDETTQKVLTRWIKKESETTAEYETALEELKSGLGFSPLTGEIIAIGVLDYEKNKGVVYYQSSEDGAHESERDGVRFRPATEKKMLEGFWKGCQEYKEFISFNGRSFDVPFLMIRSAIHGLRPTKDLMSNRYLNSQKYDAKHIDLLDQLSFYGAARRKGNLHLWTRAFGLESPKAQGVTGDDIGKLFKDGKFLEIAKYNLGDLMATKQLYEYWEKYLKF